MDGGMNLNPYNFNKSSNETRGQEAKKAFSNNYAGNSGYGFEDEDEDEKERRAARSKYFSAHGLKSSDPSSIEANKKKEPVKKETNLTLYFIGFGIFIIIVILIAIFL